MAFYIKQNDTSPSLRATLKDGQQQAVDISGSEVKIHVKSAGGTLKVDETMTVVDAASGVVQYDWQEGDTDTPGSYYLEFQVTYSDGSIETFPNSTNEVLYVQSELA